MTIHWGFLGWPTVWVQIDNPLFLPPLSRADKGRAWGWGGAGGSIPLQELNEKNQLRECPFETKKGEAYVIWFAVIGWAGGSLVAVVGSRVKTICLEWYGVSEWRARGFALVVFYASKWHSRAGIKAGKHSRTRRGGRGKLTQVIGIYHPAEREIRERKDPIFYIFFSMHGCLTYSMAV